MEKNIVLCDIDGTIANNDHRQHFLEGKKDWDGFFGELINDSPIMPVIEKINQEVNNGNKIIFITGRPGRCLGLGILIPTIYFPTNRS